MSEILFRAWDDQLGMSSEFGLGVEPHWPKIEQIPGKPGQDLVFHQRLYWKTECEIMQYTGLNDFEGKKIFVDDIVCNAGDIELVLFHDGMFGSCSKGFPEKPGSNFGGFWGSQVQIRGNIHDNPELLR